MRILSTAAALLGTAAAALPSGYPTIPMKGISGDLPMPLVGLGTWEYDSSKSQEAVTTAFQLGYRHVDTALIYANQVGVGKALQASGLKRDEYFVTSKIPGGLNASATAAAADQCLSELKLDHVDLMLLHFPASFQGKGGPALRKEEWLALEKWAKSGKARAIGVSHYCKSQLDDVLSVATLPVALSQVEYHVGMGRAGDDATDYKDYFQSKGIVFMSFSTLCGPCPAPDNTTLLKGDLVTSIGKAHNKTGAQVSLRWAVQQGIPVVPKTSVATHLREDFDLFSFNLTEGEMAQLSAATKPAVAGGGDGHTSGDCGIPELII
eukprot:CAMPEP_0197875174 /NCGR_PEP_ID=MMETSP1439-20131203/4494_1 /TAXON_ID=66791 /ORGANISM="Gonyaulax spinifera, Strain CCMP409" /LENGTH=321 /DNA_ID=CAMNT_0043494359 /DNA_START=62 /DNA_END=1027 /DNA_ORIENTATION=-